MKSCKTYSATIYIAGDLSTIKAACRKHCLIGACVSIVPAIYVYAGGAEDGAAITIMAYPRFPKMDDEVLAEAELLANTLLVECCQRSCSIVTTDETYYIENPSISIPR